MQHVKLPICRRAEKNGWAKASMQAGLWTCDASEVCEYWKMWTCICGHTAFRPVIGTQSSQWGSNRRLFVLSLSSRRSSQTVCLDGTNGLSTVLTHTIACLCSYSVSSRNVLLCLQIVARRLFVVTLSTKKRYSQQDTQTRPPVAPQILSHGRRQGSAKQVPTTVHCLHPPIPNPLFCPRSLDSLAVRLSRVALVRKDFLVSSFSPFPSKNQVRSAPSPGRVSGVGVLV